MIQQYTQSKKKGVREIQEHTYLSVAASVKWLTMECAIWEFRVVAKLEVVIKHFWRLTILHSTSVNTAALLALQENHNFLPESEEVLFFYFLESTFLNLTNLYSANPPLMAGLLECKPLSTLPWAVWFVQVTLEQK